MSNRAYLTAATLFRDETRYLREWIEYHRLIGVDKIVMVNNDDKAEALRSSAVLAPYVRSGLVEEIRFLCRDQNWQMQSWIKIIARVRTKTEWLLLTDADAFLYPMEGDSVLPILYEYDFPDIAGLAVYVATFGSNGVQKPPALQTQAFLRRANTDARCNWTANYIIRPERMHPPDLKIGYCEPLPGCVMVDELMTRIGTGKRPGPQQRVRLNHYSMRSAEDWARKVQRGWPEIEPTWKGPGTVADHKRAMLDRNDVYDDGMLRFGAELTRRMEQS